MRLLYLVLLAPLGACSHTMYLSGADERGGTVNMVTSFTHDSAVEKANDHCRDYHLAASVVSDDPASNSLRFVCQPAR